MRLKKPIKAFAYMEFFPVKNYFAFTNYDFILLKGYFPGGGGERRGLFAKREA